MFASLSFRHPFRKYQRLILHQVEAQRGARGDDHKYHIVAPPGSGKTVVGLELIRRFGFPAVVFAPTATIQQQWQEKAGLFVDDPARVADLTSLDPARLAPINIFTYQLISTPGQAREFARRIAVERWVQELLAEGRVPDEAAARARLDILRANNPRAYDQELASRYQRVKRDLLRRDDVDVEAFLHPHARDLIRALCAYGVRTIVLDECHHLLDYWAIVLRHLIRQVRDPRVIGLTATLPSPDDDQEYERYTSLLGEADFEVPTPAVVKEGDLAPYRDLVYFVRPSPREHAYLLDVERAFEAAVADLAEAPVFRDWVARLVADHRGADGRPAAWSDFLDGQPELSLAALRFLHRAGYPLPPGLPVPADARDDMTLDDWTALLEPYALNVLKVSPDAADHRRLAALRKALQPFGLTLGERGLRQGRSPGDLVLALSESKDDAVVAILAAESGTLGDALRAVVVTDFERMSTGAERLGGVLELDAGSAVRVFRRLAADPATRHLNPVLATGRTLRVAAEGGPQLVEYFNATLAAWGLRATCAARPSAGPASPPSEVRAAPPCPPVSGPERSPRAATGVTTEGSPLRIDDAAAAPSAVRAAPPCPPASGPEPSPRAATGATTEGSPLRMDDAAAPSEVRAAPPCPPASGPEPTTRRDEESGENAEYGGSEESGEGEGAGESTASGAVLEVVGEGRDWSSRTYIRLVTAAFERGLTYCLVGTRGIFGEGWDSLVLNTLIDLTGVTTSTSVQQLRGRTIRKDPDWPRKVAHNWDVICVAPEFRRGDADLRRFQQRHTRYWGIMDTAEGTAPVVKGVSHVDPDLAYELAVEDFREVDFERYTRRMLDQVGARAGAYDRWGVGEEYAGVTSLAARLPAEGLDIRTLFTFRNAVRRILAAFAPSAALAVAILLAFGLDGVARLAGAGALWLWAFLGLEVLLVAGLAAALAFNTHRAYRLARELLLEPSPRTALLDMGGALVAALRDARLVAPDLRAGSIQVAEQPDGSFGVSLDATSPEDAATFIQAFLQLFEPVRDQRYLLVRDDSRPAVGRLWRLLATRSAGSAPSPGVYPVPGVLAARKDLAETFARAWGEYVAPATLLFTRGEAGRRILLDIRAAPRRASPGLAFETWH